MSSQKSIIIKLPEALHKDFKVKCALDGTTMQQKAVELFNYYSQGLIQTTK